MATVRYLDRKLLRNIIRHTETHNRLHEEDEMWRGRARPQEAFGRDSANGPQFRRGPKMRNRDRRQMERIQRMNPDSSNYIPPERRSWNGGERNRDIFRAELGNQERWGHTGFMELYPEEFINKESMDEMSDDDDADRTKKKKKRMKEKRKRKRDANRTERKSHKRRKPQESSSSSSEDSDSSTSSSCSDERTTSSKRDGQYSTERRKPGREQPKQHGHHRRVPSVDKRMDGADREHGKRKDSKRKDADGRRKRVDPGGDENSHRSVRDGDEGNLKRRRAGEGRPQDDRDTGTDRHRIEDRAGTEEEKRARHEARSRKERPGPGSSKRGVDHDGGTGGSDVRQGGERERRAKRSARENGDASPRRGTQRETRDENHHRSKDRHCDESDRHRQRPSHKAPRKDKRETTENSRKDRHGRKK